MTVSLNNKPLIGISPEYYEHKDMDRSILGKAYSDMVLKAGGIPLIIPPGLSSDDIAFLFDRLAGLVLSGGDDIHPALYGEDPEPLTEKPFHQRRGEHDKLLIEYCVKTKLPTLAICLGLQDVNVFHGGTLYQDIPSQIPHALVHRIGDWFDAKHMVSFSDGSLIRKATGASFAKTNSAHHQAIKTLAPGFHVTAKTEDGIIEAIEPDDSTVPLLAVQWHPEMEDDPVVGIRLFEWLVEFSKKADKSPLK